MVPESYVPRDADSEELFLRVVGLGGHPYVKVRQL